MQVARGRRGEAVSGALPHGVLLVSGPPPCACLSTALLVRARQRLRKETLLLRQGETSWVALPGSESIAPLSA